MTRLSVLDVTPVPSGATARQALANTVDLARRTEAMGYHRYWVAEHHNAGSLACPAPEIVIAQIASATSTIRVGSGGVMLPNHSPLKVAETFRLLEAFHPGRIDLGVGRAAGTDNRTALALRQAKELLGHEGFPGQLDELCGFLGREPEPDVPFGPIKAIPVGVTPPPVFVLGSGAESAALAAAKGLGFAYAHHLAPEGAAEAMRAYGRGAIVATAVLCAATDAEARALAQCTALWGLRAGQGLRDLPFPSVAEAAAYVPDEAERQLLAGRGDAHAIGDEARVKDRLAELAASTGADELMIVTMIHDHEERVRSYERVARLFL